MDDQSRQEAAETLCTALEAEFELLHGTLDANYPRGKSSAERSEALARRVDSLTGAYARTALCLSGGGIRSATFCVGAIQALARLGLLDRFHYLSTVSGGGYAGAWLSSWIARDRDGLRGVVRALQGKGTADLAAPELPEAMQASDGDERRVTSQWPVDRLRAYTNYLSPVWGLSTDALTLVATFTRNLILHWTVLIPLLLAAVLLPRLHVSLLMLDYSAAWLVAIAAMGIVLLLVAVAYISSDLPESQWPGAAQAEAHAKDPPTNRFAVLCTLPLVLAAVLFSVVGAGVAGRSELACSPLQLTTFNGRNTLIFALAGVVLHLIAAALGWGRRVNRGLSFRRNRSLLLALLAAIWTGAAGGIGLQWFMTYTCSAGSPLRNSYISAYSVLSVPALMLLFWLAVLVYVGASRRFASEDDREWWSRASAASLGVMLAWISFGVIVLCLPQWVLSIPLLEMQPDAEGWVGAGAGVLGALSSAWGYWSKRGAKVKAEVESFATRFKLRILDLVSLAFAILLLFVLSLLASQLLSHTDASLRLPLAIAKAAAVAEATHRQACQPDPCKSASATPKVSVAEGGNCAADPCAAAAKSTNADLASTGVVAAARYNIVLTSSAPVAIAIAGVSLAVFAYLANIAIGVNAFSLHSMYGNRLVRAYLGATRRRRHPHWFTGFDPEDNIAMANVLPASGRLFHVINVALNLAQPAGDRLEWQQRKAASFTISPTHSGSPSLGYAPTQEYGRQRVQGRTDHGITLGRAIAISGAAASPNMGYHTSKLVAFAMTFFNVRLGWWMPNTKATFVRHWEEDEPPRGLVSVLAEATARTSAQQPFVYLSDGGHFENLGLYEMVRRRCRHIVVVDVTEDATYKYEDLESSVRKMRIDLGAEVSFPLGLPTPDSVKRTGSHFAVGVVKYADSAATGHIVYIKPALSGDEPLDVARYAVAARNRAGPTFPHDPTSRQAFDEAQFESYRVLGMHSVLTTFGEGPISLFPKGRPNHGPVPAPAPGPAGSSPKGAAVAGGETPSKPSSGAMVGPGLLVNPATWVAGAVLAGSIAVTGTVALKDNKVELRDAKVSLDADALQLSPEDRRATERVASSLETLGRRLESLSTSIGVENAQRSGPQTEVSPPGPTKTLIGALGAVAAALPASSPAGADVRLQISSLSAQLQQLRAHVDASALESKAVSQALNSAATSLSSAAASIQLAASRLPASAPQGVTATDVAKVIQALDQIRAAIAATTPRRSLSGPLEGGR